MTKAEPDPFPVPTPTHPAELGQLRAKTLVTGVSPIFERLKAPQLAPPSVVASITGLVKPAFELVSVVATEQSRPVAQLSAVARLSHVGGAGLTLHVAPWLAVVAITMPPALESELKAAMQWLASPHAENILPPPDL